MFDIGFSEIGLIAVVALLVLGPERLPKVARTAGALVRRARASWQNVRDEIERELAAEDLKRSIHEVKQAAANLRSDVATTSTGIESSAKVATPSSNLSDANSTLNSRGETNDERH